MSWYTLPFPRTPIRKLTGFKGFYFIKVRDICMTELANSIENAIAIAILSTIAICY